MRTTLGLGELYHGQGKRQQALEHLTAAVATFDDTGMAFWLAKAIAARGQVGGV